MVVTKSWREEKIDNCWSTDTKFHSHKMNKFWRYAVQYSAIADNTVSCTYNCKRIDNMSSVLTTIKKK